MAIDTRNKRQSVMGYSGFIIPPVPDTVIDAGDREAEDFLYRGIAASGSSGGGGGTSPSARAVTVLFRRYIGA